MITFITAFLSSLGIDMNFMLMLINPTRSFGIEIEVVDVKGGTHQVADALNAAGICARATDYTHEAPKGFWRVTTDASLECSCCGYDTHTAEVVSPILKGMDGYYQLVRVLQVLKAIGANTNHSTGIHVHVGAPEFWGSWNKLHRLYDRYIGLALHQQAGRNFFNYAESVSNPTETTTHIVKTEKAEGTGEEMYRYGPRTYAVNYCAMYKHRTIEYRQLQSTLDYNTVVQWVAKVVRLTEEVSTFDGCSFCGVANGEGHTIAYCNECYKTHCTAQVHGTTVCPCCNETSCREHRRKTCYLCNATICEKQFHQHAAYCGKCGRDYCGTNGCPSTRHCDCCGVTVCGDHFRASCEACGETVCAGWNSNHGQWCNTCNKLYCGPVCDACTCSACATHHDGQQATFCLHCHACFCDQNLHQHNNNCFRCGENYCGSTWNLHLTTCPGRTV